MFNGNRLFRNTHWTQWLIGLGVVLAFAASLSLAQAQPHGILPFDTYDSLETIQEKIQHNGYQFTVSHNWVFDLSPEEKERFFSRRPPSDLSWETGPLDRGPLEEQLTVRQSLPSSFDWRNHNGQSYIGPIRNQGTCGSCYAFGALAAAEGTYNYAHGRTGANCIDFSESYVIWCLGRLPEYRNHFFGCEGADYSYSELEALTVQGVTTEANFPYTGRDPGSCTHWSDPTTVFQSWHRVDCNNIEAIKTAIMTYGVVDAAVWVGSAFEAYNGGVYEDSNTTCNASPCYNARTNHAVALVGWDDNPPGGGGGYWILRNSWGTSWGENGYMRIRYTSARVACAVAYLTIQGPTNRVATPHFDPDGGIYPGSSIDVTVSCATTGATIRYTTNGSEPTESSPTVVSGKKVSVPLPGALKARAWRTGMDPSLTKSANFARQTTLTLPVTENFNASTLPAGWSTQNTGTGITERWSVSNTTRAGGAAYEMKCSWQDVNPGTTRLITPAIDTSGMTQLTLAFRHFLDAYGTGASLKVQTSNDKSTWSNTGWAIATNSSNIGPAAVTVPITTNLNAGTTYLAFAVEGNLYQVDYWYLDNISITGEIGSVATPTFSPDGGEHPGASVDVAIACATPGATIRYTTNGSEPTESSPSVGSGGTISAPVPGALKARAWKSGMNPSDIRSAVYTALVTRIIRLGGDLAFGNVTVGQTATRILTIYNDGNSTLSITGITYPSGFTGNWSSGNIAVGGSRNVTVAFSPTAAQNYGGTITVHSDKTSGTHTRSCSGTGTPSDPGKGGFLVPILDLLLF